VGFFFLWYKSGSMLFLTFFVLSFTLALIIVYRESLARKRLRDIEEIKQKLRFFSEDHVIGREDSAADVKFILRCCRAWKLNLQDFGVRDEDELVTKALDASDRAERYLAKPGLRDEARKVLATYTLKHI